MEILLLTPDSPFPSESGAAIRNYGIIRGLHDSGHKVTLLTMSDTELDPSTNWLYQFCRDVFSCPIPRRSKLERVVSLITSQKADMEDRLASAAFTQKLATILDTRTFDVIQFSGIELGSYLSLICLKKGRAKVVYDALNAEAELQRLICRLDRKRPSRLHTAFYSAMQARRLERFERNLCESVDAVIAVSNEDRRLLKLYEGSPVHVMPNGIFVDDYEFNSSEQRADDQLVFTGKMDYRPNIDAIEWFCASILPGLLRRHPALKLLIVGRNPHPRIQTLAENNHVDITGWVEAVQPYLQAATLFVLPMRMGSGTRLKILEAMASGCTVVSTSLGASGLHDSVREAIEIANDADSFARSISSLLGDEHRRRAMSERAREQVQEHYDWSALMHHLLRAYEDIGLG